MKNFIVRVAIISISILLISGCRKDHYETEEPDNFSLLYETSKFKCYSLITKVSDTTFDEIITVNEAPNLKIYLNKNQLTKTVEGYDCVACYSVDEKDPIIVYLNYSIQDNGYLLNYYTETGDSFNCFIPLSQSFETKGRGQDVIDCINDAYSNHGWASVWAIVQSAFIPETMAVLATACVVKNM